MKCALKCNAFSLIVNSKPVKPWVKASCSLVPRHGGGEELKVIIITPQKFYNTKYCIVTQMVSMCGACYQRVH